MVFVMKINPDEDYLDPQTGAYISSDNVKEGITNVNAIDNNAVHERIKDEKLTESNLVLTIV